MSVSRSDVVVSLEGKERSGGTTGFTSWERLAETLAPTLNPGERIVQFEASVLGLHFIVERAPA